MNASLKGPDYSIRLITIENPPEYFIHGARLTWPPQRDGASGRGMAM
ncbi:hypothetical protein [Mycetohabitans endofungorum]|nr:hypothetical protein [Mycetohabitans endofungorum]